MNKDNTASSYNNPLWNHFYIPNDSITKRFKEVLNDYENLPANFIIIKTSLNHMAYRYWNLKKKILNQ